MIYIKLILTIIIIAVFGFVHAQDTTAMPPKHGRQFIDLDGDGYNDNAPDHDGDGIPNGLDPDWTRHQGRRGKARRFYYLNMTNTAKTDSLGPNQALRDTTNKGTVQDSLAPPSPGLRKRQQRPGK